MTVKPQSLFTHRFLTNRGGSITERPHHFQFNLSKRSKVGNKIDGVFDHFEPMQALLIIDHPLSHPRQHPFSEAKKNTDEKPSLG